MKYFEIAVAVLLLVPTVLSARCRPGDRWKEECNTCFCTDNGLAACTRMACDGYNTRMGIQGRECEPGARWKEACNSCFCTEFGWAACTRMGCASGVKVKRSVVKDEW